MISKILLNMISVVFRVFPRNKHLWVTGKVTSWEYENTPPAFFDNSKYFYLYLVNNTQEKVYWLSSSDREIDMLKKMRLPVVRFPSLKGLFIILRAKFSFHHYGPNQIDYILQRGSIQLDFWHGTPLKKIRYDVVEKPKVRTNWYLNMMNKGGVEYVFSTSKYLSEVVLCNAFAVEQGNMLNFGYPRMDVMRLDKEENRRFCEKYSHELLPYINLAEKYSKVFLYMPTYRDDDPDYLKKAHIDFSKMSKVLKAVDGIFFLKLHPLTREVNFDEYENIVQIGNDVDIYPFLIYTDYLITDYSSIFFDYLVLGKEIIFIPYDYTEYVSRRKLYFEYDEIIPGKRYDCFEDFINALPEIDNLNFSEKRKQVYDMMIDDYNFNSCERTYSYLKEKYGL